MSARSQALSLFKRSMRLAERFHDPLVQRKMKSNVRECFRFGMTRGDKASIQYLIDEGNRAVDSLYKVTSLDENIQAFFGRKMG